MCYNTAIIYESMVKCMSFSLLPRFVTNGLTDITPEFLHEHQIKLLMMDFDNTIIPYVTNEPTAQMDAWLKRMACSDIQICVVSNSKKDRVKIFCKKYGIPCITRAKKPFSRGIEACLTQFGVARENAALVGDQIYTDTLGGNCAGVTSILTKAIYNQNFWLKARHALEMPFILLAKNRRINQ